MCRRAVKHQLINNICQVPQKKFEHSASNIFLRTWQMQMRRYKTSRYDPHNQHFCCDFKFLLCNSFCLAYHFSYQYLLLHRITIMVPVMWFWCCQWYYLSRSMIKPTKSLICAEKTQISLGIHPVWSESSLSAWRRFGSLATRKVHSKDPHQTGWMHRLITVFVGCTSHFVGFVMFQLILFFYRGVQYRKKLQVWPKKGRRCLRRQYGPCSMVYVRQSKKCIVIILLTHTGKYIQPVE